jgi:UDP-N-acetylmuramoylalanine--D-glutamate ligase
VDALLACDVVIKSPGVSRYRPEVEALVAAGVAVVGGLGLWLEEVDRSRVVCVTGTKGKSTTVAVLGHLLTKLGHRCFVGGNIGAPPFDPDAPADVDWWVIEVSSFQATDLSSAPGLVAVTSLHPDHLDWHGSEERYYADKLSICTKPGARRTVANGCDAVVRAHASLLGNVRWVTDATPSWIEQLGLRGSHNRINAAMAAACLEEMGVQVTGGALAEAASGFEGLPSRLQTIAARDGVEFVDDSLSTNVLPTKAAVEVFAGRRVALLVGGHDRNIDYAPLATFLARRPDPVLVVAMPDNGPRIHAAMVEAGVQSALVGSLEDAVVRGAAWARPDGVVLLSPAAPSFGRFADYRARAAAFAEAVAHL